MSLRGIVPYFLTARDRWRRFDRALPLLRFLRRKLWLVLLWPACAVLLGGAGWWRLLSDLESQRYRTQADILKRVDAFAQSYAERTARAIGDVDQTLRLLRHNWINSGRRVSLAGTYQSGVFLPNVVSGAGIIDQKGAVLTGTRPISRTLNVFDQPYFDIHRHVRGDFLYITSPLTGLISKREVIVFTRKLVGPSQRFEGIVAVSVFPSFFTLNYTETLLGRYGILALVGEDGVLHVARIGNAIRTIGTPLLRAPFVVRQPQGTAFLDGRTWFFDGRSRFVAWYPVQNYRMAALVGVDEREAMSSYWLARRNAIERAWWNTVYLAATMALVTGFYIVAAWKQHQIKAISVAYRLATEDAGDGFFIKRPLHDGHGEVVDFVIVDCNRHGAELFGLRCQDMIGHRLSEFDNGEMLARLRERLCEALEKGVYDDEVQVPQNSRLTAKWLRYKAVRADGDLSVTVRDISEAKAHLRELERRSNEDELTGLPNRCWILQYLPRAIAAAREAKRRLAILFIDLDGFKTVNDALGHAAGDELLRTVGKRLKIAVRPLDQVVRLGGDEFVVLLENIHDLEAVEHVADRVLDAFRDGFHLLRSTHVLNASIGISLFPEHGEDAQTLLKNADIAMYSVKTDGKGSFRFFQSRFYEAIRTRSKPKWNCGGRSTRGSSWCTTSRAWT